LASSSFLFFFLASLFRFGVHFHILDQATVDRPPLFLQVAISLSLLAALYFIVRIRHGSRVWALLGWNRPRSSYLVLALVGGIGIAVVVDSIAHATTSASHLIRFWDLLLLDVLLGPVAEESFFSWLPASRPCPQDRPSHRNTGHCHHLCDIPSREDLRAMGLLCWRRRCLRLDSNQVGLDRSINPHACRIQRYSVLVPNPLIKQCVRRSWTMGDQIH
jgi:hypothetical protein